MGTQRIFIQGLIILLLASFCFAEVGDLTLTNGLNVTTDVNVGDDITALGEISAGVQLLSSIWASGDGLTFGGKSEWGSAIGLDRLEFRALSGTNTDIRLLLRPKGTGEAYIEATNILNIIDVNFITSEGKISALEGASEGVTEALELFGFGTGDELRSMTVGIGEDSADSVSFSGVSDYIFTGRIDVNDGVVGAPSYSFTSDTDVGFYLDSGPSISASIAGVKNFAFEDGQIKIKDSLSANLGIFKFAGTAMTGARTFTLDLDNSSRTFKMSGNLTVEAISIINQDLSSDSTTAAFTDLDVVTLDASGAVTGLTFNALTLTQNVPGQWLIGDGTKTITITEDCQIDQNLSTTSAPGFATGVTIGNLTLANGSITDSSNAIDFGNEALSTSSTITGDDYIHTGDSDTKIVFGTDIISMQAGGVGFVTYQEVFIGQDKVLFNVGSVDLDVDINGDNVASIFHVEGATDTVHLKTTTAGDGGTTNYLGISNTGDFDFKGSSGLVFGSFWGNDMGFVVAGGTGTYSIITDADITVGQTNNTTFQNNQELDIGAFAGMYLVNWSMSVKGVGAGKHITGGIGVDVGGVTGDVAQNDGRNHAVTLGNSEMPLSGCAILDLSANDEVSLMVTNESDNTNVTVEHVALTITQIGGT